jgi:cysteine synthase
MLAQSILDTIGNTPLIKINKLFGNKIQVYAKMEKANPGGSIKDRIALSMIADAEKKGLLSKGSIIIEPTSGNTGVGLAMVAAVKGYELILVMPESMSLERRRLMKAYGAKLELTPREKGIPGAIEKALEMAKTIENSWMPMQFDNEANTRIHMETTAAEILRDFPEGFDYQITGVGTGGHITGVDKILKKYFPQLKSFAVEPALSPVLSGGKPGSHPIQGIGAGFIPSIMDTSILEGTIQVTQEEAFIYTQRAAREEGLFVGISSGAAFAAVAKKLIDIPEGSKVLTFSYDTGERYLSIEGLFV